MFRLRVHKNRCLPLHVSKPSSSQDGGTFCLLLPYLSRYIYIRIHCFFLFVFFFWSKLFLLARPGIPIPVAPGGVISYAGYILPPPPNPPGFPAGGMLPLPQQPPLSMLPTGQVPLPLHVPGTVPIPPMPLSGMPMPLPGMPMRMPAPMPATRPNSRIPMQGQPPVNSYVPVR